MLRLSLKARVEPAGSSTALTRSAGRAPRPELVVPGRQVARERHAAVVTTTPVLSTGRASRFAMYLVDRLCRRPLGVLVRAPSAVGDVAPAWCAPMGPSACGVLAGCCELQRRVRRRAARRSRTRPSRASWVARVPPRAGPPWCTLCGTAPAPPSPALRRRSRDRSRRRERPAMLRVADLGQTPDATPGCCDARLSSPTAPSDGVLDGCSLRTTTAASAAPAVYRRRRCCRAAMRRRPRRARSHRRRRPAADARR